MGIVFAGSEFLRARVQMALDHHAKYAARAGGNLRGNIARYFDLFFVLLAAVSVAAVHHQCRVQLGFTELCAGLGYALGVKIGRFSAAQNDVAVFVAVGLHNRHLAVFVH